MAKRAPKKASVTEAMAEAARGAPDAVSSRFDKVMAGLQKRMSAESGPGGKLLSAEQAAWRCGGIGLPSLCLRWLVMNEAFPMGRTLTLSGPFRSMKSTLSYELGRWILCYAGIGVYYSVEQKDSPDLRCAVCRHDQDLIDRFPVVDCFTQEMWQGGSMHFAEELTKYEKGKFTCLGIGICDTIAAAKPAGEVNKFLANGGHGKRGYSSIALYNADWLQQAAGQVAQTPFLLCLVQHSTEKAIEGDFLGRTKREQKGGGEVGFAKTTAFELTRIEDFQERHNGGGCKIKIECTKNGLGPTGHKIFVPVHWWWDEQQRQHTMWDWYAATIDLLLSFESVKGRKTTFNALKEIVDIRKGTKGRYWSKALGVPESEQMSPTELGLRLEYDFPHLMPAIYEVLHIQRRPILPLGGDLLDVWNGKIAIPETPAAPIYPRLGIGVSADEEDEEE